MVQRQTLALKRGCDRFEGGSLATHHNQGRASRAAALRVLRADIEWRTPSGVPFAWIGGNPPAGYLEDVQ